MLSFHTCSQYYFSFTPNPHLLMFVRLHRTANVSLRLKLRTILRPLRCFYYREMLLASASSLGGEVFFVFFCFFSRSLTQPGCCFGFKGSRWESLLTLWTLTCGYEEEEEKKALSPSIIDSSLWPSPIRLLSALMRKIKRIPETARCLILYISN